MKYEVEGLKNLYSTILTKLDTDPSYKELVQKKLDGFGLAISVEQLESLRNSLTHDLEILSYITGQIISLNKNQDLVIFTKFEIDLYTMLTLRYYNNSQLFEGNLKHDL